MELSINIESNHTMKNPTTKDTFVIYDIGVRVNSKKTRELVSSYLVQRRFREFDNLHNRLKRKFNKYSRPLPDFPKKLFELKKSTKRR